MRVVVDYRPALRNRSGAGEYTHQLVRALLAAYPRSASGQPLELTLLSSSWKDRLAPPGSELDGAEIIDRRLPVRLLNFAWHRLEWPPAEQLTGRSFDVTHSSHPLILPAVHAAQVITIHDLDFLTHPERTRAEIRRDYPRLVREHAHRADRILVPSLFTAGEVEARLEVPPTRISVCSPGAPDWSPRPSAPVNGYVLFLGTLEPRKNVGTLLDAFERLLPRHPAATLVLAGKPTEAARPWLDRIRRPPLQNRVRSIGYVDPARRQELYAGAAVLVQPSFEEGFGLPVLEAMTLGIPVVAANRGALPEVLGDGGPLVDPENADELAQAIERLLGDEVYARGCRQRGIERARRFSWTATARAVYEAYRLAIEHRQCVSA